jgi:ubiquinone/menaquinone biosynthesis C-methylase UbiE
MRQPHDAVRDNARAYALGARRFADRDDDRQWLRPLVAAFRSYLHDGALVADLGCASGRETVELQQAGLRVVGLDIVPEFLALARRRYPCDGYVLGTLTRLPFAAGTFDGLWASASFLHLSPEDALVALREAARVLKRGGLLYTSVQRGGSAAWAECPDPEPGAVRYYRYYEPEEWSAMAAAAGLDVEHVNVTGWSPSNNAGATGWIEHYARAG